MDFELPDTHFDSATRDAVRDIIVLLRAVQNLGAMKKTFKNAADLDLTEATPMAKQVINTLRCAAMELQESIFKGSKERASLVASVRENWLSRFEKAAALASKLAEAEKSATTGNVIQQTVELPIKALVKEWQLATAAT